MQPLAQQYNLLASGQALDSTLQAVITQVVAAMTAAFTEIKGATWSATDTLEQIANAPAPSAATVATAVRSELATELARMDVAVSTRNATAPANADIAAIKAKTDSLNFTVGGKVDSNIQYINEIEIKGVGTEANPWNPV